MIGIEKELNKIGAYYINESSTNNIIRDMQNINNIVNIRIICSKCKDMTEQYLDCIDNIDYCICVKCGQNIELNNIHNNSVYSKFCIFCFMCKVVSIHTLNKEDDTFSCDNCSVKKLILKPDDNEVQQYVKLKCNACNIITKQIMRVHANIYYYVEDFKCLTCNNINIYPNLSYYCLDTEPPNNTIIRPINNSDCCNKLKKYNKIMDSNCYRKGNAYIYLQCPNCIKPTNQTISNIKNINYFICSVCSYQLPVNKCLTQIEKKCKMCNYDRSLFKQSICKICYDKCIEYLFNNVESLLTYNKLSNQASIILPSFIDIKCKELRICKLCKYINIDCTYNVTNQDMCTNCKTLKNNNLLCIRCVREYEQGSTSPVYLKAERHDYCKHHKPGCMIM